MHLESPAFKRCCLCVPLRRGLIGWGYVRLAVGILALTHFIFLSISVSDHFYDRYTIILVVFLFCAALWDIAFNLTLIVASHKKSAKLLKVSFILGLVWLIMFLACGLYLLCLDVRSVIDYWYFYDYYLQMLYSPLAITALTFAICFVHVYVILMIHSESKKLLNQSGEMQFVNNAAEGEAGCVYAPAPTAARMTNMTQ